MYFHKAVALKNGNQCLLRNAEGTDAEEFLDYFIKAHGETDYLTTYPDETGDDLSKMSDRLASTSQSDHAIEIVAVIDGRIAGSAGISMINPRDKTKHRAEFGVSVLKDYWGMGIGNALTAACIDCARKAGYLQLELDVVAQNQSAVNLYLKHGFEEYGRNPRGFRTRDGRWQELVLMRLPL